MHSPASGTHVTPDPGASLRVRHDWQLLLSVLAWGSGWLCAVYFFLNPAELPPGATKSLPDSLFLVVAFGFNILFGPILTLIYSTVLDISESTVQVRRYFDLVDRTYSASEVGSIRYSERRKADAWFEVVFRDGNKVRIERSARNAELAEKRFMAWLEKMDNREAQSYSKPI